VALSPNPVERHELRHARSAAETRIDRWIEREQSRAPLKAKSLVVTVWGDAIAPHGGAVWLSGLIRLLAPLGLNERLVRTSVYRLARDGWLIAQQDGRRSLYRLTEQGLRRFEHAYRRIYASPAQGWDGRWEIVLAPPGALGERERRDLRKELWWEGFGNVVPGVFVRPAHSRAPDSLGEVLHALGVERRVSVVTGHDTPGLATPQLNALVRNCWHLAALSAEYRGFLNRFASVMREFRNGRTLDPQHCFVVRSLLIHAFRRVTLHDPQLPRALLPPRWPAAAAYALCRDFYRLTHKQAERHLVATLATDRGTLPPAAPYFYERFGGL
jgi:phenylacetic acid degradation operon negative regulatory protein